VVKLRARGLVVVAVAGLIAAGGALCSADTLPIAEATKGWTRVDGFLPFYTKGDSDEVWLEVDGAGQDVLYGVSLAHGAGARSPALERGVVRDLRLCRFERVGRRVLPTQRSTRFREGAALVGSRALEESFATSVLASFAIGAQDPDGRVLVDVARFLTDEQNVRPWAPKGWKVDGPRSLVVAARSEGYPQNTDFETLVTLVGDDPSDGVCRRVGRSR
jgi:Domain of unknown function (DUF5117)